MNHSQLVLNAMQQTNYLLRQLNHQQLTERQRRVILEQVQKIISTLQELLQ